MIQVFSSVALAASLLLGAALCTPQAQSQQQAATVAAVPKQQQQQQQQQSTSSAPGTSTSTSAPASLATDRSTQRPAVAATLGLDGGEQAFDGRSSFGDDSLWRLPIRLVRDPLGRSASSGAAMEEPDEESELVGADELLGGQAPPALISASTSGSAAAAAYAPPPAHTAGDLKAAAGYHHATPHHYGGNHHQQHGYHGKYFQYASVPHPYAWEFGYRRGNPYHTIERHEHGKGPHFQTKVKWSDKYGGYGVHVWDYNHDDQHHNYHNDHHNDHYSEHHAGGAHKPAHYGYGGHR